MLKLKTNNGGDMIIYSFFDGSLATNYIKMRHLEVDELLGCELFVSHG